MRSVSANPVVVNQARDGPGTGDERIVADGAGVEEQPGGREKLGFIRQPKALGGVPHRVQRADGVVLRSGEGLAHGHGSGRIHGDTVGESAADVHADHVSTSGITHDCRRIRRSHSPSTSRASRALSEQPDRDPFRRSRAYSVMRLSPLRG